MTRRLPLALLLLLAAPLFAQKKVLTLEAVYDPSNRVLFSGAVQSDFEWIDDKTFLWPAKDAKGDFTEWRLFDTTTGKHRPLIDKTKLDKEKADALEDAAFDAKKSAVVIDAGDDLWLYSIASNTMTRLTNAAGDEELPAFSPDGKLVAFVRDNDLYVVDLAGKERRLTTDGSKTLLNGKLDWVYQEEIYGRGTWKSYWWSPDSTRIAFLQLDETGVPEYTILDEIEYHPKHEVYPYPKSGDPNPKVALKIATVSGGPIVTVDNRGYAKDEPLIVNVDWDKAALTYQVQNREQTWLELNTASTDGDSLTLLRETTKAWVDPIAAPVWLADGTFLWQSERSGWRHLYRYRNDGTLLKQITKGEWEVRDLHGSDGTYAYFSGTERSPIGMDVYRVKLDGSGLQRLSSQEGTHGATFNPASTLYVDKWSDIRTPDQIRVHRNDGKAVHVVEENRVTALTEFTLPNAEFLQVKTRDGFPMEAVMIKPSNFDPSKKYPVYQYLYAGPHAQTVRNVWGGLRGMFHQLVAEQGVIVWMCDNRTASGKGAVSAWPMYKNAGELELRDIEDAAAWLKSQPYIDGSRFMISGWSGGGFMVSYALTHSKAFSAGIAGGSVTDWRDYDSIFTERFMLTPEHNPEGYKKSAPRFAAKNLYGKLLLIHGTTDDNVHAQNTLQFAYELQEAGKLFEMMLYPRTRHSVTAKATQFHLQGTMLEFIRKNLLR